MISPEFQYSLKNVRAWKTFFKKGLFVKEQYPNYFRYLDTVGLKYKYTVAATEARKHLETGGIAIIGLGTEQFLLNRGYVKFTDTVIESTAVKIFLQPSFYLCFFLLGESKKT